MKNEIVKEEKVNYLVAIMRTLEPYTLTDYLQSLGFWDDDTFVTDNLLHVTENMLNNSGYAWKVNIEKYSESYFVEYDKADECFKVTGLTGCEIYESTLKLKKIAEELLSSNREGDLKKFITWFKSNEDLMDGTDFILDGSVYAGAELISFLEEPEEKTFDYCITLKVSATDLDKANELVKHAMGTLKSGSVIDEYTIC